LLGVPGLHRDLHQIADLGAGKDQIVADLLLVEPQVLQPVVAHVIRAVAVEAIVDEHLRAALQGNKVTLLDGRAIKLGLIAGSKCPCRNQQQGE